VRSARAGLRRASPRAARAAGFDSATELVTVAAIYDQVPPPHACAAAALRARARSADRGVRAGRGAGQARKVRRTFRFVDLGEDGALRYRADAAAEVAAFLGALDAARALIAFNGLRFDIPFVAAQFKVPAARVRAWEAKTLDFYDVAKQRVAPDRTFSLNNLLEVNGLQFKTSHGAEAVRMAQAGEWARLEDYCADDARLTWEVASLEQIVIPEGYKWRNANKPALVDPARRLVFVRDAAAAREDRLEFAVARAAAPTAAPAQAAAAPAQAAAAPGAAVAPLGEFVLLDSSGLVHRSYHGMAGANLSRADGQARQSTRPPRPFVPPRAPCPRCSAASAQPRSASARWQAISAVLGFSRIVQQLRTSDFPHASIVAVFDHPTPTFRSLIEPESRPAPLLPGRPPRLRQAALTPRAPARAPAQVQGAAQRDPRGPQVAVRHRQGGRARVRGAVPPPRLHAQPRCLVAALRDRAISLSLSLSLSLSP
jgi:hypothetical protein